MPPEPLHSSKEAAKILGMAVKTLNEHARMGRIRYIKKGGGTKRPRRMFTSKNIQSFIERQKVREVPACPSTGSEIRLSTNTTFKSTVIDFMAVPKPGTSMKPNKSSVT
jgi:hypothetical protein